MKATFATALALCLAACGSMADKDSPLYNAGFGDGCNTAEAEQLPNRPRPQRDEALYAKDADYRSGWNTGHTFCRPMSRQGGF